MKIIKAKHIFNEKKRKDELEKKAFDRLNDLGKPLENTMYIMGKWELLRIKENGLDVVVILGDYQNSYKKSHPIKEFCLDGNYYIFTTSTGSKYKCHSTLKTLGFQTGAVFLEMVNNPDVEVEMVPMERIKDLFVEVKG